MNMDEQIYLIEENCPVCNSNEKKLLGHPLMKNEIFGHYESILKKVEISKCMKCNLLYLSPIVHYSDEFLKNLYPLEYWGNDQDKDFKNMKDKQDIFKRAIKLYNENPKGKKLLDIGCGMGEFLKIASDYGMEPLGMDLNNTTTDYITSNYGYKTLNKLITEETFEENSFDFVVLSHVIEHVQDPNKLIRIIYKILKPGGIFIMATPNAYSLISNIYNFGKKLKNGMKYSFIITPFINPYHILGFDPVASEKLLNINKFKILYNKAQPTYSWKEGKYKVIFMLLKFFGSVINRGEQVVTISQK